MSTPAATNSSANQAHAAWLQGHCQRQLEQVARLAEMDLDTERFHAELMQRTLTGSGAASGALWRLSAAGIPQLEYQANLEALHLDSEGTRAPHDALLRQMVETPGPVVLPPHSGPASADGAAGNPTAQHLLAVPVLVDGRVAGLLEVWRDTCDALLQSAVVPFLIGVAHCVSVSLRNRQRRTLATREELWSRLEDYGRQVHADLDLRRVAFVIANQGRQLVDCDRLSVAVRRGRRVVVEAVSGVETVSPHAPEVRLLRELCEAVLGWGETLVYHGAADESLPPNVWQCLDAYLARGESKLLAVHPLSESDDKPPHSALVLECFEPAAEPEPLLDRLVVVGRHSEAGLRNAASYRRVPLRWLWQALPEQGGSKFAWALWGGIAAVALVAALAGVAWPLKVEANGQLLPRERRWLYPPAEGQVVQFAEGLQPGTSVGEGQTLALMHDTQLEVRLTQLAGEVASAQQEIAGLTAQQSAAPGEAERATAAAERKQKEFLRDRKLAELTALRQRVHADEARPGYFWLTAPVGGTVLTWDFRERWTHRFARPTEPLLRLGNREGDWEVEVKIPSRELASVLEAFAGAGDGVELDVDLLLLSDPTHTYHGKLARCQLAVEAVPDPDAADAAPTVRASVRIDGPGITEGERVPRALLVSGTEVHARVRCGPRRLGYVLFRGVGDFLYEHVLFQ